MKLGIAEILENASKIEDNNKKIEYLRQQDNPTLRMVLQYAYSPSIKWLLPEGNPPYKENQLVDQQSRLYTEARKFYLFVEGGNPNLKQIRREFLFIELLEVVDPKDAVLLLAMKDKKLPYPNLTPELIQQTFPGLF